MPHYDKDDGSTGRALLHYRSKVRKEDVEGTRHALTQCSNVKLANPKL